MTTMRARFVEFVQDENTSPLAILGALTVLLKESGGTDARISDAVDRAVHSEIDKMELETMRC